MNLKPCGDTWGRGETRSGDAVLTAPLKAGHQSLTPAPVWYAESDSLGQAFAAQGRASGASGRRLVLPGAPRDGRFDGTLGIR